MNLFPSVLRAAPPRPGGHIYVSSMAGIDAGPGSLAGPAIQDQAGNAP